MSNVRDNGINMEHIGNRHRLHHTDASPLRVASFFSGIGGFDLGFERAGCQVIFQCEKNSFCQQVLRKHWPAVQLVGDIDDLKATDIPEADVWCGGFPCQDLIMIPHIRTRD